MSSEIWFSDDSGTPRQVFSIGQTIFVTGRGLRPSTPYDFKLTGRARHGKPELLARYVTDRHGGLIATPLLPYIGLIHPGEPRTRTYEEAHASLEEQTLAVLVSQHGESKSEHQDLKIVIAPRHHEPRLF